MFKLFSTRLSMVQFAAFLAATSSAFILSACAGGVGEETNSIVGAAEDDQSVPADMLDPQVTAPGTVDSMVTDTAPTQTDKQADIGYVDAEVIVHDSTPTEIHVDSYFYGRIYNNGGQILDISVKLPDGVQQAKTDSLGKFTLNNLPDGTYPMFVSTGNSGEVAYLLQNGTYVKSILGPVSAAVVSSLDASSFDAPPVETIFYDEEADSLPVVGSDSSYVPFEPADSIAPAGNTGTIGNDGGTSLSPGTPYNGYFTIVAANELPNDIDYGVVKHWNSGIVNASTEEDQNGIVTSLREWNVEVKFVLKFLDTNTSYIKNIFGQFDGKANYFSLALINGECGTTAPSLAFFVGEDNKFSCSSAVISAAEVKANETMSVTATVNNGLLKLYKNGFLIANNYVGYSLQKTAEVPPFVFGDTEFDLKLNDVRLGEKAINSADVLYRYYQ